MNNPADEHWKWGELVDRMRKKIADAPDGSILANSSIIDDFRDTVIRNDERLKPDQRLTIIDQAIVLLEQVYAHLPLKQAMHAVAPVQRLRVLRDQHGDRNDLDFHHELREIFTSVRDLHTNYFLPTPYKGSVAYLPFTISEYWAMGPTHHSLNEWAWRYVVTDIQKGFLDDTPGREPDDRFKIGVQILYWNGTPIERLIERLAEQQAGGNPESRRARAVASLTLRPLDTTLPPDEDWVNIRFRTVPIEMEDAQTPSAMSLPGNPNASPASFSGPGKELEFEHSWLVYQPGTEERREKATTHAMGLGLDEEGDSRLRARVSVFAPHVIEAERKFEGWPGTPFRDTLGHEGDDSAADMGNDHRFPVLEFSPEDVPLPAGAKSAAEIGDGVIPTVLPRYFRAKRVHTEDGTFGYIKIYTFLCSTKVPPNLLVSEFVRLVTQLPQDGLILDVRDNPGGTVHAGERLLQTLTPRTIEPERLQFINTPLIRKLCNHYSVKGRAIDLSPWQESVEQSVRTGATYSRGFPITSPESCNLIGQKYHGPVVLVTNGRCYSTTDFFIAGFKDHEIGPILGCHVNTGAGGANVWEHEALRALMSFDPDNPFEELPRGARMRVAIRRSLRVGENAGTPLEDLGVEPDIPHTLTYADLTQGAKDILFYAGQALRDLDKYYLRVECTHLDEGKLKAKVWYFHTGADGGSYGDMDRLDVFVDDRPRGTFDHFDGSPFEITVDAPELPVLVDFKAYHKGKLTASRRVRRMELWNERQPAKS